MSNVLVGKLVINSEKWSYSNDIFWNRELEFWDEKKINNWENYYSLIIWKNWVWKTSFIKYLIDDVIKEDNENIQLMFTTHSVFDDIKRSDGTNNYIYNWIKWKNNSANSKSIYNLNKIKIFSLLERNNNKIIDTLKYIYNLNDLDIDDIKVKFTFIEWLKKLLSHDEEWLWDEWYWINKNYDLLDFFDEQEKKWFENITFDLLDEIKEVFNNEKYRFEVKNISEHLLIAIYVFVTISDKIEIKKNIDITQPMNIHFFYEFKKMYEKLSKKYKRIYNKYVETEFKKEFLKWIKDNSISIENDGNNILYKHLFSYIKKEIKYSEFKKEIKKEKLFIDFFKDKHDEASLVSSFHYFFTDSFKNFRYVQDVLEYDFYFLLNEVSRIRQTNWGYEAFTYDIGYLDKKINKIKYFWNSSSWELVLLYTYLHLTDFTKNKKIKKVLIIDEPEISLHPQWQKDYISNLDRLFKELKLQNVFTIIITHSPLILLWWQDLEVKNSNELVKKYNVDTYAFYIDNKDYLTKSLKLDYISMDSIDEVLWNDFWVNIYSDSYINWVTDIYNNLNTKYEINKKK